MADGPINSELFFLEDQWISPEYENTLCIYWTTKLKYFNLKSTLVYITTHLVFKT